MTFDEYQNGVWRTFSNKDDSLRNQVHASVYGLSGEIGEFLSITRDTEDGEHKLILELGDILYYNVLGMKIFSFFLKDAVHGLDRMLYSFDDLQRYSMKFIGLRPDIELVVKISLYIDTLKKIFFHGHPNNLGKIFILLQDILVAIANSATHHQVPLTVAAKINNLKLKERYPQGFSVERSIQREG